MIHDEIIQNLKLHHTKASYLAKNVIGRAYQKDTINLFHLHQCDAFVIGFDETELIKTSQLEILFKLSHEDHGIQLRHYRTIDLESGDAETILDSIIDAFKEDSIDYENKPLGAMQDVCNVMEGRYNGVKKRFRYVVPQFQDSCNSHHIGNAFEYAVKKFNDDSHEALVNTFFDIGGAKRTKTEKRI